MIEFDTDKEEDYDKIKLDYSLLESKGEEEDKSNKMERDKENVKETNDGEEEGEVWTRTKTENRAEIERLRRALEVHLLSLKKAEQKEKER